MVGSAAERCRTYPPETRTENEDVIVLQAAAIARLKMAADALKTALRQAWTTLGIRDAQQDKFLAEFDAISKS